MFNVAVINIKDIIRYLICVIFVIIVISCITKYFFGINSNNNEKIVLEKIQNQVFEIGMDQMFNEMNDVNKETENENIFAKILKIEFSIFEESQKDKVNEVVNNKLSIAEDENIQEKLVENENVDKIFDNLKTEVVTENPIVDNFTYQYNDVKIKNETGYELSDEMFGKNYIQENKNIIIFHTHTCESYTASDNYSYTPTGNFRTTDKNYSVVRVGDELTNYLSSYGYNVTHDSTYHDYPSYNGSYTRSLQTVSNLLKIQDAEIIIDLHRDAIGSKSDYAPLVKIGDEYAAQLMFVIGTNGGGLNHPNWEKNLQFAVCVQQKAEEMYPGLFKSIILRNSRYNQHLGESACIIEVGATGNTLDQCLVSQKYLSKIINEVLK